MADTYYRMAIYGVLPARDAYPRAKSAAQRALAIDNTLVGPVVALAAAKMGFEWDWPGAERLSKQALELDADYAEAHEVYAMYLAAVGRTREAVEETRQALDLDPITAVYSSNLVWRLLCDHRYEEADLEHRRLLQLNSFFKRGPVTASLDLQLGRQQEALAIFREDVTGPNATLMRVMFLGRALGLTGNREEGRKVLERMLSMAQEGYVPPDFIAVVYEGLGNRDKALEWFERAYEERSVDLWLLPDPQLDSIRSDPRFKRILRGMGLAQ